MISIDASGPGPFTGIICGFEFYTKVMRSEHLPAELQGYEIVADGRVLNHIGYLVKNGDLVTTYIAKFKK